MKKTTTVFLLLLFIACGVKTTQNHLNSGNYNAAIDTAVSALRSNKDSKGKQEYIYLLEEAFSKAVARDQREIKMLEAAKNTAESEKIYNLYIGLQQRQEKIIPLLPLRLLTPAREAQFTFHDYTSEITKSRNAFAAYSYQNAAALLQSHDKAAARKAYENLAYLNTIYPNYKDVTTLMEKALVKGTEFVYVTAKNETRIAIPKRLQNELLDFSTFGLDDQWTIFHNSKDKNTSYDYTLTIRFQDIVISPEQTHEKEFVKERDIEDGEKNKVDGKGNTIKDGKGNPVKVPNYTHGKVTIYEFRQYKSCFVKAQIEYLNLKSNQLIGSFPLSSEFVFESIYAKYKGNKKAADTGYYTYFDKKQVPFPSNEQMISDTSTDLKLKLKTIIINNRFHN